LKIISLHSSGVARISQRRSGFGGDLGAEPPAADGYRGSGLGSLEEKGSGSVAPSAGRFLKFFNKNNAFCVYFCQNSCFKTITHQLKAFEINYVYINKIKKKLNFSSYCERIGGGGGGGGPISNPPPQWLRQCYKSTSLR